MPKDLCSWNMEPHLPEGNEFKHPKKFLSKLFIHWIFHEFKILCIWFIRFWYMYNGFEDTRTKGCIVIQGCVLPKIMSWPKRYERVVIQEVRTCRYPRGLNVSWSIGCEWFVTERVQTGQNWKGTNITGPKRVRVVRWSQGHHMHYVRRGPTWWK